MGSGEASPAGATASATVEPADEQDVHPSAVDPDPPLGTPWTAPARRWWVVALLAVVPPLLAFGATRAAFAVRTGAPVTDMTGASWGRWDTGNYADIAEHGYYYGPCVDQGRAPHGDICAPAAWYPAFPYLGRWVRDLSGWSLDTSFVVVAQLAFLALLVVVWTGYLRARLTLRHVMLLTFAAFFPGAVYFMAEFPISLLVALLAAQFFCFVQSRWILGAVFGALASLCYPIAVVVPLASAIWCFVATRASSEDWKRTAGRSVLVGGIVSLGTLAVFVMHQIVLGNWLASFEEQKKFGGTFYNPAFNWWHTVIKRNSWIQEAYPETRNVIAAQTVLVTLIVLVCVAVVVFQKRKRTAHDVGLLVMLLGLWLFPLASNIETGLYRRVGPLLPATILLLRRAPWPVTLGLTTLSVGVWWWMVPKFYTGALI